MSVDGGWLPLPTHPQRYCDLVSLVSAFSPITTIASESLSLFNRTAHALADRKIFNTPMSTYGGKIQCDEAPKVLAPPYNQLGLMKILYKSCFE